MGTWNCPQCGIANFADTAKCRRCQRDRPAVGYAPSVQSPQTYQQQPFYPAPAPYPTNRAEYVNRGGKTCPRCGITNSFSQSSGTNIVLIVVLFITCIGLLALPFLPKTWYCRHCGFTW